MDRHTHSAFGRLEIVETGRRRRWSDEEKHRIVLESMSGPRQVSATARRHNVARSQVLAWRRAMLAEDAVSAPRFVPAVLVPDVAAAAMPADVRKSRIEVVLRSGRWIIFEGGADMDAVLKLARGLEALSDPDPCWREGVAGDRPHRHAEGVRFAVAARAWPSLSSGLGTLKERIADQRRPKTAIPRPSPDDYASTRMSDRN